MNYWRERFKQVKATGGQFDTMICWDESTRKKETDDLILKIKEFIPIKAEWDVLDYGCGCGRFSPLFEKYLGIDIVEDLIIENKSKYPNKKFEFYDINELPIKRYDIIFNFTTLQHLNDAQLHLVLDRFSVMTTNLFIGESIPDFYDKLGKYSFNRKFPIMKEILISHKFQIEKTDYINLKEKYYFIWAKSHQ